jgi:hypothetical protein
MHRTVCHSSACGQLVLVHRFWYLVFWYRSMKNSIHDAMLLSIIPYWQDKESSCAQSYSKEAAVVVYVLFECVAILVYPQEL